MDLKIDTLPVADKVRRHVAATHYSILLGAIQEEAS